MHIVYVSGLILLTVAVIVIVVLCVQPNAMSIMMPKYGCTYTNDGVTDKSMERVNIPRGVQKQRRNKSLRTSNSMTSVRNPIEKQLIPRCIIQTNKFSYLPALLADAAQRLREKNPSYDYEYFDDERARQFIADNCTPDVLTAYNMLIPGAYKADLFRYAILSVRGGVYIDCGMVCELPLDDWILPGDMFIAPVDSPSDRRGLYNAVMMCTPKHPVVLTALQMATANVLARFYGDSPLDPTGPILLGRAFCQANNLETGTDLTPGERYPYSARLIDNHNVVDCPCKVIVEGERVLFKTKVDGYYLVMAEYTNDPHYTQYWLSSGVYA